MAEKRNPDHVGTSLRGTHSDISKVQNLPTFIAPSALVKPKGPILLHSRQANGAELIRRGDILGQGTRVEIEVNSASQSPPGDIGRPQEDLLRMGIAKEHAVGV